MDGQVTWLDLGISCGKTWSEPLTATKEKTSRQSSKRSSKSSSRKPPVLKCLERAGLPGGDTTMKWEDDGAWCGELMTRNTGECPNAAVVSRLSQILEETPHPKYNLTAKACQGILRRAERRGKDLQKLLKAVLIRQSQGASPQERTETPAPTEAPTSYAVRIRGGCDGGGKGALVQTEKSGTLGTGNDQTIFCMATQQGGAELRTGGNQVPLTYQDVTGTLSPGAHAGSYNGQDAYNDMLVCGATPDVAHTLRAKANCAYREDAETYLVQNMVVRRLTPLECTRLQGYPDGWVDIGDWTDEKGKKHKDADSPKYKALGNSIALPFWDWMLRRMARYLPEGATLGSLFDGIGGFPLCFERIHGKGTARWASEIEPFPIAVTKRWFGEE